MNKLLMKNMDSFVKVRMDQLQADILQDEISDVPTMIASITEMVRKSFGNLASPMFTGCELGPIDRPEAERFTDDMTKIQHDIALCYNNLKALRSNMDTEFNATTSGYDMLESNIGEAMRDVRDITVRNDVEGASPVVVVGDDFNNSDWIDPDYSIDSEPCFLDVQQGGITLPMAAELSAKAANASVSVVHVNKNTRGPADGSQEPTNFFHEGQFYGIGTQVIPAGGAWNVHVVPINQLMSIDQQELYEEFDDGPTAEDNPSFATRVLNGTVVLDGKELIERPKFVSRLVSPDEQTLKKARNAILDGNPDTFWQCEWVFTPGQQDIADTQEDTRVKQTKSDYLEVGLLVDLGEHVTTNRLVIDPVVFHPAERLEVVSITTAASRDEIPQPLDYQGVGLYSNALNDFPDRPVTDLQDTETLSPDSDNPGWLLAWTFSQRRIRFINVTLRQRVAYLVPYQTMYIKMTRTAKAVSGIEER